VTILSDELTLNVDIDRRDCSVAVCWRRARFHARHAACALTFGAGTCAPRLRF